MEENVAKFSEKLKELLAIAKKKKNVLEFQEINDFFVDMDLDPNQIEQIYEYLESNNIDVLKITEEEDIPVIEDEELENIDLTVPEGISIEDPVRMY